MVDWVQLRGLAPYAEVHALQLRLVEQRAADEIPDTVLLVEHPPTITLGRKRGAEQNVMNLANWPVVPIERGGDATLHLPGQLVAYPIVKLEGPRKDLHRHLHALEDAVIGLCGELGVVGHRDDRNTGVWITADGVSRKVCSIGIACRRWVTYHGLAVNIDNDPHAFRQIRPCGFESDIMTRLCEHVAVPSVADLAPRLVPHLARELGIAVGVLRITDLG